MSFHTIQFISIPQTALATQDLTLDLGAFSESLYRVTAAHTEGGAEERH